MSESNANVKSDCDVFHPQPLSKISNEQVTLKTSNVSKTERVGQGDKYALEINIALKGEKIHLAKQSTVNKKNQNQSFFIFIPVNRLQSHTYDSTNYTVCKGPWWQSGNTLASHL